MKRGEVTTVNQLSPGDRFYKSSDKKKSSFELIGEEQHEKFEVCAASQMKNGFPVNNKTVKIFRGSTVVIYLRNVNEAVS